MASASWALQKAVHLKLTSSPAIIAQLGGPKIYDDVPRGAQLPYVTLGVSTERDWSTGSEEGGEHILTLHAWSKAAGRLEVDLITDALKIVLHDQTLTLDGQHLVNMRQEVVDTRRDEEAEMYHAVVRLRAVTEPAS